MKPITLPHRLLPRLLAGAVICIALGLLESIRAASPPTADLAVWLRADGGVTTTAGNVVTAWADQAGGTDNSATALGDPELGQASFANGPHPVIRFSGNDGFDLANDVELEVGSLSVYVVGSVNSAVASEIFISHFKPTFGWALGISDSIPGRVKWFTSPPQSLEPAGGQLGNNLPTFLTGTFAGGTKTLYVNGVSAGSTSGLTLDYGGGGGALTVGYLGCCGGIQKLQGDIAEILVYSSVSDQQRTEVEAYLKEKYVDPRPPTDGLRLWLRADEGVQTLDGVTVSTWEDQAGGVLNNGVATGTPTLQSADFPSGSHAVIRLDGGSGLTLDNVNDLDIPSISIYVVGSVDNSRTAGTFISNLRQPYGFSLGVSLTAPGRARFYTGVPQDSLESAASDLPNATPFLLAGTFDDASTTKKLYLGGVEVASVTGVDLNSATENVLAIGYEKGLQNFLAGDIAEILVYSTVSDAQRTAVELYLRRKYFGSGIGPAIITGQPESHQVNELDSVSFTVVADGSAPLSYQWRKNGTPITGATAPVYGIPEALRTDAGSYTVRVNNSLGEQISEPAVLTVIPDNSPPTLVSAVRDFGSATTLNVFFSERLRADTANLSGNYVLDRGATVGAAALSAAGDSVVLTTSALNPGTYTLTVNNVRDRVGNLIAPNSKVTFEVINRPVPSQDLRLWLRADAGVGTEDGVNVATWADQGGGIVNNGTATAVMPQLREELFSTGLRPVIRFGDPANSGFVLENSGDLRPEDLTIYIVGSIWEASPSKIFIGNYRDVAGWAVGISDGVGGRVKWFTAPPNSMEPPDPPPVGADLVLDTPYLLTASYQKNGNKRLYIDGSDFDSTLIGEANDVALSYAADTQLTVGTLQGGRQWLRGSIAEILVYSSVNSAQKTAVEAYLTRKYFGGGSGPPVITFQPQDATVDEFSLVTFEVGVDGTAPFTYQWFKGSEAIQGAERSTYTLQSATRTDAGEYSVRVENGEGSVQSRRATLTLVNLDTFGPTLVSAKRSSLDQTHVTVVFSEPLDEASAIAGGNYKINGVAVTAAAIGENSSTVSLTTSPALTSGATYTLTVSGVKDRLLNTIVPNSTIPVQVPTAVTATPPAADRILWLKADEGLTTGDGGAVLNWADQAGDVVNNGNAVGTAQLAEADFAGGLRPVIRFNQGAGFELENPDDLARPEFSVYVVGSVDNTLASEIFISHFKPTFGWALGISDGTAGRVKWFTSPPQSQEPSRASLGNNVPTFLTGTFGGGTKKLFVNGAEVGRVDNATVDYGGGGGVLSVGHLGCCGNIQRLKGDIAEILVYSTVSDAQRTAVEDYIRQKYFPDVVPPTVASARRLAGNASVQVAFSEGVSAVTANARANYTISGGVVVNAAALQPDGQTVLLDTSAVGDGAVLTVNGVKDRAGNTIAANSQVPIINSTSRRQQSDESDGLLVLEAEHYDVSVPGGGSEWLLTSLFPGFSGPGAMDAAPNLERNVNIDTTVSPRLDYNVQFVRSGLHYVWVRALGDSAPGPGTDDSVNVGFDQQLPATSDRITGFPHQAGFVWSQATLDNASATIDVAAAGPHSISVWMREDGLVLDKLLITSNPAYIPTGAGPNESSLSGSDLGRITIVRNGANVVLTWTATGATLQQAASPAGPWSTAANASPFQTPSTQPARFYRLIR